MASSSTQHEVKGPARTTFSTFDEASAAYAHHNFANFATENKTHCVPTLYGFHKDHVPAAEDASTFCGFSNAQEEADFRSQIAEERIFRTFVEFGFRTNQPMFVFHSFNFKDLKVYGTRLLPRLLLNVLQQETDALIVHRRFGIILVETKAMKKFASKMYSKAKEELTRAAQTLFENKYFQLTGEKTTTVKMVIAMPNLSGKPLGGDVGSGGFFDLRENHLAVFDEWWTLYIESSQTSDEWTERTYPALVQRLLCGRGDLCVCLNAAKILHSVSTQSVLKENATATSVNDIDGGDALKFTWVYLTPEQVGAWHVKRQVIFGPYGSGKTLLIISKVVSLAVRQEASLVIVPSHLLPYYNSAFVDACDEACLDSIDLVSIDEFMRDFYRFERTIRQKHVFVDELMWPYHEASLTDVEKAEKALKAEDEAAMSISETAKGPPLESSKCIEFLLSLVDTDDHQGRHYVVWIVPHLYYLVRHLVYGGQNDASAADENSSSKDAFAFYKAINRCQYTTLTTTMRSTYQLHRFRLEREWTEFCDIVGREKLEENRASFLEDAVFQCLFGNRLGHTVSGPPVQTVVYRAEAVDAPIQTSDIVLGVETGTGRHLKNLSMDDHDAFVRFAARAIADELRLLLLGAQTIKAMPDEEERSFSTTASTPKLKLRDIAVLYYHDDEMRINTDLLQEEILAVDEELTAVLNFLSIEDQLNGDEDEDGIAIGSSADVSSLEWAVVFLLQPMPQERLVYDGSENVWGVARSLNWFCADYSIVATRAIVQLVRIVREEPRLAEAAEVGAEKQTHPSFIDYFGDRMLPVEVRRSHVSNGHWKHSRGLQWIVEDEHRNRMRAGIVKEVESDDAHVSMVEDVEILE